MVALPRLLSVDILPFFALFLPLGGFLVLSLFEPALRRDREERGAGILACATVVLSFAASAWTALHLGDAAQGLEAVRAQYHLPPRASPYMPYQPWIGPGCACRSRSSSTP